MPNIRLCACSWLYQAIATCL